MSVKFSNNGYGTLAASINSTDTSITVDTGQGARFPTLASGDYFYATLIDSSNNLEIIKVTARATDVLTAVRGQDNSTARSYAIGDRIELRMVAAAIVDPSGVSDQANSSTGYFGMPTGTTAQRPGSAAAGYTRYNTTTGSLEFYDGTNWISTNLIPTINSITGTIYAGASATLTLSLTNATNTIDVKYYEGGTLLATDSGVTVTAGSATSTVPSAVYGQTAGDTITISVWNTDGTPSSNSINKTVAGLPTGGTITTSGGYFYHTFTSSSSLVVPSGFSSSADYLIVAGGGGGSQGGGGGGGMLSGSTTITAQSFAVVVGAGGAATADTRANFGANGSDSSIFGLTAIGGGGGGAYGDQGVANRDGRSGGSGGGGGGLYTNQTNTPGGSGTSGQGNAGGGSQNLINGMAGGGGGKGSAGVDGDTSTNRGGGGSGAAWVNGVTYAGGGGGGASVSETGPTGAGGVGGSGGGATGGKYQSANATAAGVNTGGGGGGGGGTSVGQTGTCSAGGSGIVIVRYQL